MLFKIPSFPDKLDMCWNYNVYKVDGFMYIPGHLPKLADCTEAALINNSTNTDESLNML